MNRLLAAGLYLIQLSDSVSNGPTAPYIDLSSRFCPIAASSFAIKANYSTAIGLPVPDKNGDMITSVGSGLDISSRSECLSALRSELVEGIATGYGLDYGAHHVVLKCTEYWEYENCSRTLPGCIGSAEFGNANHIQIYYDGAIIEPYLRFSSQPHEVVKTVMYGADEDGDGNLDIGMVLKSNSLYPPNCAAVAFPSSAQNLSKPKSSKK